MRAHRVGSPSNKPVGVGLAKLPNELVVQGMETVEEMRTVIQITAYGTDMARGQASLGRVRLPEGCLSPRCFPLAVSQLADYRDFASPEARLQSRPPKKSRPLGTNAPSNAMHQKCQADDSAS